MQYELMPTTWAILKRAQFAAENKPPRGRPHWKNISNRSFLEEWELINKFVEEKKYNQLYLAVKFGLDAFFDLWTKLDDIETNTELFKEILESSLKDDEVDFHLESSVYMKIISMRYANFIYASVDDLQDSNFRTFFDYDTSIYIPPFYKSFVLKDFFVSRSDIYDYEAPELCMDSLVFLNERNIHREFISNYLITKIVKDNLNRDYKFLDVLIDNSKCISEYYILN